MCRLSGISSWVRRLTVRLWTTEAVRAIVGNHQEGPVPFPQSRRAKANVLDNAFDHFIALGVHPDKVPHPERTGRIKGATQDNGLIASRAAKLTAKPPMPRPARTAAGSWPKALSMKMQPMMETPILAVLRPR